MPYIVVSKDMLRRTRHSLRVALVGVRASHIAEALACSLGFRTSIALNSWLDSTGESQSKRQISFEPFVEKLNEFGYDDISFVGEAEDWKVGSLPSIDPFSTRSAEAVINCIVSRIHPGALWIGTAERLLGAAVPILLWGSENSETSFDAYALMRLLDLTVIREISEGGRYPGIPADLRSGLISYMRHLPPESRVRDDQHQEIRNMICRANPGILPPASGRLCRLVGSEQIFIEIFLRPPFQQDLSDHVALGPLIENEVRTRLRSLESTAGGDWSAVDSIDPCKVDRNTSLATVFVQRQDSGG